jgi:hypothetical protein
VNRPAGWHYPHRSTGSGPETVRVTPEQDVLAEVRSGDVVVIPHGWHGPSSWAEQPIDPRLPMAVLPATGGGQRP